MSYASKIEELIADRDKLRGEVCSMRWITGTQRHNLMSTQIKDERMGLPSASSMERDINCPGSRSLIQAIGPEAAEQKASKVCEEGSAIALALETGAAELLEADQREIAENLSNLESVVLDEFIKDHARDYDQQKIQTVREDRLWIVNARMVPVASAKLDVYFVVGDVALVIDHKSGFLEVPHARSNWQIRTQVVALKQANPELRIIRGAIAQYRLGGNYTWTDYTEDDLDHAERQIRLHTRERDPLAPRVPGHWCRYCPAKGYCIEGATRVMLADMGDGKTLSINNGVDQVETMTFEAMAEVFKMRKILESFIDAMKARLLTLTKDQLEQYGLTRTNDIHTYSISDVPKAIDLLSEHAPREELLKRCTLSINNAVDVLAGLSETPKKEIKKHLIEWLEGHGAVKESSRSGHLKESSKGSK